MISRGRVMSQPAAVTLASRQEDHPVDRLRLVDAVRRESESRSPRPRIQGAQADVVGTTSAIVADSALLQGAGPCAIGSSIAWKSDGGAPGTTVRGRRRVRSSVVVVGTCAIGERRYRTITRRHPKLDQD